jgi:hypothetical protein
VADVNTEPYLMQTKTFISCSTRIQRQGFYINYYFCNITSTDMAMVQKFEVIYDRLNLGRLGT